MRRCKHGRKWNCGTNEFQGFGGLAFCDVCFFPPVVIFFLINPLSAFVFLN